jgi:adenosylmethionine---8-amino-7-oxononanoate aminotransferase
MIGIDLGDHDPALRLGHRVTIEARRRGAIIRPLGDVIVLMPPLAISKRDLRRLVTITAEAIGAAVESADGRAAAQVDTVEIPAVAEIREAA